MSNIDLPLFAVYVQNGYFTKIQDLKETQDLREKNEQLQKLAQEMYKVIKERNSWWDCMSRDAKRFADRMRDLGIEVD